ncbi:MAG: DUF3795 domain-containing protein [Candidatus Helarchaeota archaeon]
MTFNPNLLAPCGLYCGVCAIYQADKQNNQRLKAKLAKAYWCKPEQIHCDGCLSSTDNKYFYCKVCKIRDCVQSKAIPGCHKCEEWPCTKIQQYPYELAKTHMLQSIPARKVRSDAEWVAWEEKRWTCDNCGTIAFRGAKRCPHCKAPLSPK